MNRYDFEDMVQEILVITSIAENEDGIEFHEFNRKLRKLLRDYVDIDMDDDDEIEHYDE